MLLELRQLSQSLQTARVAVSQRDNHLVAYPNGKPLFRVTLTETGCVNSVSRVEKEQVSVLLKFESSTGGSRESIPGFNVPPLFAMPESISESATVADQMKQLLRQLKKPPKDEAPQALRDMLDAITGQCVAGWSDKAVAIGKRLKNAAETLFTAVSEADEPDKTTLQPLNVLLCRIKQVKSETLRTGIIDNARQRIIDRDGTVAELENLLQFMFAKDAAIMLDLADWTETPANHEGVWLALNRVLLASRRTIVTESAAQTGPSEIPRDVFDEPCPTNNDKMPEKKLPRLGNVKLRSNAKSKACQTRYGLSEGSSCPVASATAARLADALAWLTDQVREGKTWHDISGSSGLLKREGGKPKPRETILLAYPNPLPPSAPSLAAVLAKTAQQGPTPANARFEASAQVVVRQLADLKSNTPSTNVVIFVLYKRDKARTKLLLSQQYSVERIIKSIRAWTEGAKNLPPVCLQLFGEDKNVNWVFCAEIPFPSEVNRVLNRLWVRGGERMESVATFHFSRGLSLLLDEEPLLVTTAREALRLAVSQWVDLLLAMGQAMSLRRVCVFNPVEQQLLPPILGLLLYKLGHRKEVYMNDAPYWIGRLLAVADRFQINYCKVVRGGDIPRGPLVGNATMSACLENPRSGLSRLAERLPLYQQVADENLRRDAAEIVSHFDPASLPERATDEHKAQMLLGYLSRPDLLQTPTPPTATENKS